MIRAALMNWEVILDITGFFCCTLTVLYLIKLKRIGTFNRLAPDGLPEIAVGSFPERPMDLSSDMGFDGVLSSAERELQKAANTSVCSAGTDPYDAVRQLMDLGMGSKQIAKRIKIPQCEIDLMVSMRRMRSRSASEEPDDKGE